jgi:REP element-mobilizing transposase RayT
MLRAETVRDMARKLRVQYPGAIYHVMNRGDRREPIFKDDQDRRLFLTTLAEACEKTGWQVHSLCLMGNHFHLVVETPRANLVAGMAWLLGTYTSRFNRRHKLFGHVFSGRYKAVIVDGSGNGYLRTVCEYVHLNPVRANLLTPGQPLRDFPWSSYVEYLKAPARRPPWLRVDRVLGEMGIPHDSIAGRRQFEQAMELRRQLDEPDALKKVRRGWCFGDKTFRKELLAQMNGQVGRHHGGEASHRSVLKNRVTPFSDNWLFRRRTSFDPPDKASSGALVARRQHREHYSYETIPDNMRRVHFRIDCVHGFRADRCLDHQRRHVRARVWRGGQRE